MKLFVADDHTLFRQGLIRILADDSTIEIVGEAGDGEEALQALRTAPPDVALLDVSMPGRDGLEIAQTAQREGWPTAIVILTMHNDEAFLNRALDLGVKGYLLKDNAVAELLECLKAVAQNQFYISPILSELLIRRRARTDALLARSPGLENLTNTEKRILKRIAENKTSREIADELFISYRTVQTHRANISAKLGLKGHHKLLQFALEHKSSLSSL